MTTIIIFSAVSCLLATIGIGGFLAREQRRARKTIVQPLYVTRATSRPRPRR
jgi:hypothetical protein